jgi:hypothetical protein
VSWPDPSTLLPVLTHLSTFGEVYPVELDRVAQPWLPLMAEASWISPLSSGAFVATDAYLDLPADLADVERLQQVCFGIPDYRRYLIAVLAEGLVKAGQVNYHEKLEQWAVRDLAALAAEINSLLDELEAGEGRMVEWPPEQVTACFAAWHAQHSPFVEWDQALLGMSGAPTQLFTKALNYAALLARPSQGSVLDGRLVALLPDFELPLDEAGHLGMPTAVAWTIARESVSSSLPLYNVQGEPLYDAAQPVQTIWQDALSEQPYYRAVLRVAIAVRLSGYAPQYLALFVADDLGDTRIVIGDRDRGALADLLPRLVDRLGYRAMHKPSRAQVRYILRNWCLVGTLEVREGQILLKESYARTLHERWRAVRFLRGPARDEQRRIETFLKEMG